MSDTNYKHLPLQSFAVGDTLRIFQSETSGQIFYAQNFTKEFDRYDDNFFVNEDDKIKFKHLMYGNKKYSLNKLMTADFKDNLNNTIEQDLQKETKKSLTYYDTDKFEFNQSDKRIFQIGKKCYILNYDSYVDEQDVKKFKQDNSYILTQYFKSDPNSDIPKQIWEANVLSKDLKSDFLSKYSEFKQSRTNLLEPTKAGEFYSAYMNNSINSYISSNYSSSYFEDSKNANNKAIPIYDLNGDLLDKISVIKLFDKNHILKLINTFSKENDELYNCQLDTISSTFLFNSETFKIDNENFNSIMIPIIYNHIIKIGPSLDIKNLTERRLNAFFDTLMSYIPKESFFRLFVPIGWINLSNDFYQKTKNSEVVEYLYSINLTDDENDHKSINYFTLKSFSNPELNYDYTIGKDENFKSLNQEYFNFDDTIKNQILVIYKKLFENKINDYINIHNLLYTSGTFIEDNKLDENGILRDTYKSHYISTDEETLNKIFYDKDFSEEEYANAYLMAYKIYMLTNYGLNLDFNNMSVINSELQDFMNECFSELIAEYNKLKILFHNKKLIESFDILFDYIQNGEGGFNSYFDTIEFNEDAVFMSNKDVNKIRELIDSNKIYNNTMTNMVKIDFSSPFGHDNLKNLINIVKDKSNNVEIESKKDDYLLMFKDLYKHENSMELSGHLNGFRKYNNCGADNFNNIWLSYNYNILLDNKFLNDSNINLNIKSYDDVVSYISGKIELYDDLNLPRSRFTNILNNIRYSSMNELNYVSSLMVDNDTNVYNDLSDQLKDQFNGINKPDFIIKLNSDSYLIENNSSYQFNNYLKMLNDIRSISFGEVIKGQHYYKKEKFSKSNIFSVDVKNSGFNYTLYSFNEIKTIFELKNNTKYDETNVNSISGLINDINLSKNSSDPETSNYKFCKIDFDKDEIDTSDIQFNRLSDLHRIKKQNYFKINVTTENIQEDIENQYELLIVKNKIRKHFENAIRKSIHRYIPANTVLWQIKFSGK